MNKTSLRIGTALIVVIALGSAWFWFGKTANTPLPTQSITYKNATYTIDGHKVTLINGSSETLAAPGSASKIVTTYFGNEAAGDLNNDGTPDVAFILTQTTGGSGTFYYAVGAIATTTGYSGTDAVLLGDRIAPQTTEIKDGKVTVNYADRAANEAFTVAPSFGKSLILKLDPVTMQFGEVASNFPGEADPARMTLGMQTWTWKSTIYNDGKTVIPATEKTFTLTFKKDGTFAAKTDCNGMGGEYTVKNSTITFSNMIQTLMFCDGSQEDVFKKMLTETQTYHFTSKGELIFGLKMDSGSFIFR